MKKIYYVKFRYEFSSNDGLMLIMAENRKQVKRILYKKLKSEDRIKFPCYRICDFKKVSKNTEILFYFSTVHGKEDYEARLNFSDATEQVIINTGRGGSTLCGSWGSKMGGFNP